MKIIILGATGMIGNAMFLVLSEKDDWETFGTVRSSAVKRFFSPKISERILTGIDVENMDTLINVFDRIRPDVVINCVGLTKHLVGADDPILAIPINTLLPHRLARLCGISGARLVHISTDCVFSGKKGGYTEDDLPDATDLYGKSKFLGEVNCPHAITLRTSTIGNELQSAYGLLGWFLSQHDRCKGYVHAIFSGMPTVVLAQIIRDIVIPRPDLSGLYHLSASPISKYDLLNLIASVYGRAIEIVRDEELIIDRSLNGDRFQMATGYKVPDWPELIQTMHTYRE